MLSSKTLSLFQCAVQVWINALQIAISWTYIYYLWTDWARILVTQKFLYGKELDYDLKGLLRIYFWWQSCPTMWCQRVREFSKGWGFTRGMGESSNSKQSTPKLTLSANDFILRRHQHCWPSYIRNFPIDLSNDLAAVLSITKGHGLKKKRVADYYNIVIHVWSSGHYIMGSVVITMSNH